MDPIFQFIIDSLKLADAPHTVINGEYILAQCRVEVPPSFFRPARTELCNLQFVCQPQLLEKYPGSELVTQGSFRMQWLVDGIKRRGLIFRGTYSGFGDHSGLEQQLTARVGKNLPFEPNNPEIYYCPHLLVNFLSTKETDEKSSELHSPGINLATGELFTDLLPLVQNQSLSPYPPTKNRIKQTIPYNEGYQALENHLRWVLQNRNPQWIRSAQARFETEVRQIEEYYRDRATAPEDVDAFYRQLSEIYRKFQPVIRIKIVNVAILYLPLVVYSETNEKSEIPCATLEYDPVREKVTRKDTIHFTSKQPKQL